MNLLEYEAKNILSMFKINTPASVIIKQSKQSKQETVKTPAVLKSQIPTGGRGKAGGIRIIENADEIQKNIDEIFELDIKGFKPKTILAEEKLAIKKELYLSILIDRVSSSIQIMANSLGGVEIEDNPKDSYFRHNIDQKNIDSVGQSLSDYFDLPGQTFLLQDLLENIYKCFVENDATLIEINPLVLTDEDQLVAGDCKMTLDNNAAFRHDWKFEEEIKQSNFVSLNETGNIATIANGAGLAMATVDAVADAGLEPANFLDIGGGANAASLMAAFDKIMQYKNIQAIVINIFAGITRCDEVAKAIITARADFDSLPPLFIRLAGTNYQSAVKLLEDEDIAVLPNLSSCIQAAKQKAQS